MGQVRTYGFGRVSPAVKPSPYSPLHRPSQMPGSTAAELSVSTGRPGRRTRRMIAVVLAVVAVVVLTGIVALVGRPAVRVAQTPAPQQSNALVSEEALRLSRSAIAVHRHAPRPRS